MKKTIVIMVAVLVGVGIAIPLSLNFETLLINFKVTKLTNGVSREITAYNVGDPAQTDDTPCIGATNFDLCEALDEGRRVCASNAYPLYSVVYIEDYGLCEILDRMATKYSERVDIAFKLNEKWRAKLWGNRTKEVYLIK